MSSSRAPLFPGLIAAIVLLPACSRDSAQTSASGDPLQWARAALERNPAIEVVAVDPAGVFTVRDRASGELSMVRAQDLVAAPATAPVANEVTAPATESDAPSPRATAEGADPVAGMEPAADAPPPPEYVVTRDAGGVSIVGKGVTIASADRSGATADAAGPIASVTGGASGSSNAAGGRVEQRGNEPIVCQGARSMRIDDREIRFDGDGLIVEEGCQLYLTNSRIVAGGVAIIVTRGDVHIVNSTVSGGAGAIEASLGARVFLSSASIDGLQRRFDTAQINDLGGNRWR